MGQVEPAAQPLNDLQKSIIEAIGKFYVHDPLLSGLLVNNAADAKDFLEKVRKLRHPGFF
jgi:hypothetical protein